MCCWSLEAWSKFYIRFFPVLPLVLHGEEIECNLCIVASRARTMFTGQIYVCDGNGACKETITSEKPSSSYSEWDWVQLMVVMTISVHQRCRDPGRSIAVFAGQHNFFCITFSAIQQINGRVCSTLWLTSFIRWLAGWMKWFAVVLLAPSPLSGDLARLQCKCEMLRM